MTFGKRLRSARNAVGLPQDKLGILLGLDEGSSSARISRYESGIHEPPFAVSVKLAKILLVPVSFLYCPEDDIAELLFSLGKMADPNRASAIRHLIEQIKQSPVEEK